MIRSLPKRLRVAENNESTPDLLDMERTNNIRLAVHLPRHRAFGRKNLAGPLSLNLLPVPERESEAMDAIKLLHTRYSALKLGDPAPSVGTPPHPAMKGTST